ncbi:MAG: PQ-loop repeat-containing protein [Aliidongia sp.]
MANHAPNRRHDRPDQARQLMLTEIIGWAGAAILLLTIGRQVYVQWRDKSSAGLSKWLFIGQISASISFVAYSLLLGNWVFAVTNAAMLVTAIVGQIVFMTNRKAGQRG